MKQVHVSSAQEKLVTMDSIKLFERNVRLFKASQGDYVVYVEFEIIYDFSHGSLAQLGEHLPYKQRVIGSIPITSTNYAEVAQW